MRRSVTAFKDTMNLLGKPCARLSDSVRYSIKLFAFLYFGHATHFPLFGPVFNTPLCAMK